MNKGVELKGRIDGKGNLPSLILGAIIFLVALGPIIFLSAKKYRVLQYEAEVIRLLTSPSQPAVGNKKIQSLALNDYRVRQSIGDTYTRDHEFSKAATEYTLALKALRKKIGAVETEPERRILLIDEKLLKAKRRAVLEEVEWTRESLRKDVLDRTSSATKESKVEEQ